MRWELSNEVPLLYIHFTITLPVRASPTGFIITVGGIFDHSHLSMIKLYTMKSPINPLCQGL